MLIREFNRLGCPLQNNPLSPEQAVEHVLAVWSQQQQIAPAVHGTPAIALPASSSTALALPAPATVTGAAAATEVSHVFTVCYKHSRWELTQLSWDGETFSEVQTVNLPSEGPGLFYWIEFYNNMFHINESGNAGGDGVPCIALMDSATEIPDPHHPLGGLGLPALEAPDLGDDDAQFARFVFGLSILQVVFYPWDHGRYRTKELTETIKPSPKRQSPTTYFEKKHG